MITVSAEISALSASGAPSNTRRLSFPCWLTSRRIASWVPRSMAPDAVQTKHSVGKHYLAAGCLGTCGDGGPRHPVAFTEGDHELAVEHWRHHLLYPIARALERPGRASFQVWRSLTG